MASINILVIEHKKSTDSTIRIDFSWIDPTSLNCIERLYIFSGDDTPQQVFFSMDTVVL